MQSNKSFRPICLVAYLFPFFCSPQPVCDVHVSYLLELVLYDFVAFSPDLLLGIKILIHKSILYNNSKQLLSNLYADN